MEYGLGLRKMNIITSGFYYRDWNNSKEWLVFLLSNMFTNSFIYIGAKNSVTTIAVLSGHQWCQQIYYLRTNSPPCASHLNQLESFSNLFPALLNISWMRKSLSHTQRSFVQSIFVQHNLHWRCQKLKSLTGHTKALAYTPTAEAHKFLKTSEGSNEM